MNANPYPTDLTDAEWDLIKNVILPPKPGGRHRELDMREVVHAIFYVVDGGITWRMLPHEYPKWPSVYWYFSQWRDSGDWQRLHATLRAQVRQQAGRHKPRRRAASTAKASRPRNSEANAATTKAKTSKGANAICWLIRWDS
jgi:transposase